SEEGVLKRIRTARLERSLMDPSVFSVTVFPILWAASFLDARPDVYLWEKIRPLAPFPPTYPERYSNAQAAIGLAGLERIDGWTETTRAHARFMTDALSGFPGVQLPPAPSARAHVYFHYGASPPDRDALFRRCLGPGPALESHPMAVGPELGLFGAPRTAAPGARRTVDAVQLPIHAGLTD